MKTVNCKMCNRILLYNKVDSFYIKYNCEFCYYTCNIKETNLNDRREVYIINNIELFIDYAFKSIFIDYSNDDLFISFNDLVLDDIDNTISSKTANKIIDKYIKYK